MKKLVYTFASFLILFTSCTKDAAIEESSERFSIEDVNLIHENSEKKWRIINVFEKYDDGIIDEDLTECLKDEIYTFKSNTGEAEVEFGSTSCYPYPELINDGGGAKYTFYEESGDFYLDFSYGASFNNNTSTGTSRVYGCISITEDTMIFANGEGRGHGLIFEAL
ncbi:hypothetical protein [Spongiivirga citrea]|uniref:Lipocalin-like domain-containing protein n=1 Tax=Spongiivirga citrea TaxID=1481457 RepID=A0A6M0CMM7_9FLAO|nr:hypothetical protein [Spongiivirga citrea]NER17109.1 hypothetical protein [Spongiivirga citrea]